jgi:hypothetical protein
MTQFEYLSVLLSIILGLAITQILQGYRGLLLVRQSVRLYWPSLIWSVLILLFACQAWWASFGLEDTTEWHFGTFLIILLQMGLIYMLAALVLPDTGDRGQFDMKAHYQAQRCPFFTCFLLVVPVSLLKDLLLDGVLPEATNLGFHAGLAALALAGLTVRSARFQLALAIGTAILFIAYVAMLFNRL